MHKFLLSLSLLLLASNLAFAQHPDHDDEDIDGPNGEKIEALRAAYITQQLALTTSESQTFWPLYNEMRDKEKAMRKAARPNLKKKVGELTEAEADELINKHLDLETQIANLHREYYAKFKKVLSAKKLVKLPMAEREFKRTLLEKVRERRGR
jgi:Spy/CpxP family protein refolding chaperone